MQAATLRSWAERLLVMNRQLFNLLCVVFLMGITACSAVPSPYPPQPIDTAATKIAVETAVAATLTAMVPTVTPTFTPTNTPTMTPTFTPFPTPTYTPVPPPGVYVTNIRIDPPYPHHREDVRFYVTFFNTTSSTQYYRWFVFIYRASQSNPFGQTSYDKWEGDNIPIGRNEIGTLNTWKIVSGGGEPCLQYWAIVYWYDAETQAKHEFADMYAQEIIKYFWMCPPGEGTPVPGN